MLAAARTLLVADDSITIQKVVDLTFRDEGFAVTTVSNGTAAIEIIERTKPDIVLLDAQMPKPDGYEVCRRIKRDERLRHIPVLLLINSFEPYNEAEARRAGANDTLTKPFQSIRELVNKVSGLLSSARPSDEAAENKPTNADDEHRPREDSPAPEAVSTPPTARSFEPENVLASPDKNDAQHNRVDEPPPVTGDAISMNRRRDTQEDAQTFTATAATEEQADDDAMIQVAELAAPHSSTASSSSSAPTFMSKDDKFETPEPPTETSPLDETLYFDAPPVSFEPDEAIDTEHTTAEPDTKMTPHDEPHHSSNDFTDKPQTDNPFDDNLFADEQSASGEPANEDDFSFALTDDAPLDLGETQAAPLNNSDDAILDFGDDAPATTNEQFPSAMIDRESFEFADDVEVTNVEAMNVEEAAPTAHETGGAIAAFSPNTFPPEFIDHIARDVVAHLSESGLLEKVLREVAWEVVPQLAERLIKQRLDEDAKSGG
ncbi:MAG: response regulator [Pyrinomonadaceae bacterium MAG19_C2-C3]|nr:response regulator [Pyrinomonadaceae bacterium MAG19_C2-C3]